MGDCGSAAAIQCEASFWYPDVSSRLLCRGVVCTRELAAIKDGDSQNNVDGIIGNSDDFDVEKLFVGPTTAVTDDTTTPYDENSGAGTASLMVKNLDGLIKTMNDKLSTLGAASRQLDTQSTFVSKLSDVIEGGIGNLVDADLAKESAKL